MKVSVIITFVVFFIAFTFADDNEKVGDVRLTNNYLMHASDNNRFQTINDIMSNDFMKQFYNRYYERPILYQNNKVDELIQRVRSSGLNDAHSYPYANQINIDPNIVNRLINLVPRRATMDRINFKQEQLGKVLENYKTAESNFKNSYNEAINSPVNSEIDKAVASNEENLNNLKLRKIPEHTYSTPFGEDGKNMNVILNQIREMEHQVRRPLAAMLPNNEEINAMNRLSDKLNEVSKRVHQKPLENLHQNAHAQDLMLERLSNLIRRMSNAVDDTRRDQFLNQLHAMIHKYHLHDEKFISNLESEIGYALANNVPLQMPRETPAATQQANMSETDKAKAISQHMEDYGKTLLSRSHELKNRADILERRTTVPNAEREQLLDHIRNRLISPPAEVHAIGAQRPAYQYRV